MRKKEIPTLLTVTAVLAMMCLVAGSAPASGQTGKIIHDAEYYILEAQNGKKWAEDVMKTTGKAAQLSMSADRSEVTADGKDAFFNVKYAEREFSLDEKGKTNKRLIKSSRFRLPDIFFKRSKG